MEPTPRKRRKKMEPTPGKRRKKMEPTPGKRRKKMEPTPRRRWSKELPPDLSELMNKLIKEAASFIQQFGSRESRMREIVRKLLRIRRKVEEMQEVTDGARTAGAVGGGVLLGLGILAAPFTGGLSLAVGAAAAGAAVGRANITKMWSEKGSAKEVEELGKELKEIVRPLKGTLEEIKETCEKLEEKAAEYQSGNTLLSMKKFEELLSQVSKLKHHSSGAIFASQSVVEFLENLLVMIFRIFGFTATPEEDRKLRDAIMKSADQSRKVTDEFEKTQIHLKKMFNL